MRIIFLSVWFSDKMGYIENCLPKAMASLGHDVHVISSTAQVYYNDPDYELIYKPYLGESIREEGIKKIDGFSLHRLSFGIIQNKIYLKKIGKKLQVLKPDVVQTFDAFSFLTLQGAYYKLLLNYKFFTANHTVASVFPLLQNDRLNLFRRFFFFLTRSIPGRFVSLVTSRCYPVTIDALQIAVNFYKIPIRKVLLTSLGVDTDFFYPAEITFETKNIVLEKRKMLGLSGDEILCIYTGKFTGGKNPVCLAKAIGKLADLNEPFKAIFIGNGPQAEEISKITGCILHKFVPYHELPEYFRIADIGVWPKQESTSMLDASACGLPIIISDRVQAVERVEGNGLTYIENDVEDLVRVLLKMKDKGVRDKLSRKGIEKIRSRFSWHILANERIEDYRSFL